MCDRCSKSSHKQNIDISFEERLFEHFNNAAYFFKPFNIFSSRFFPFPSTSSIKRYWHINHERLYQIIPMTKKQLTPYIQRIMLRVYRWLLPCVKMMQVHNPIYASENFFTQNRDNFNWYIPRSEINQVNKSGWMILDDTLMILDETINVSCYNRYVPQTSQLTQYS